MMISQGYDIIQICRTCRVVNISIFSKKLFLSSEIQVKLEYEKWEMTHLSGIFWEIHSKLHFWRDHIRSANNKAFRLWIIISGRSSFGSSGSGWRLICSQSRINNDSALLLESSSSSLSAFNAKFNQDDVKPASDVVTVKAAGGRSDGDCDILNLNLWLIGFHDSF